MRKFVFILSLAVVTVFSGCATTHMRKPDVTHQLTILHTNDHHGHYWKNRHSEYGLAAQKTLVENIRREVETKGGHVLVLSAGDVNTGVPESDLQDAEPDFFAMSLIGYDAMALGNHEFDNPLDVLSKQKQWASFPFLSANVLERSTGKPLFDAYKIFTFKNGFKVAVVGLIAEDTPKLVMPAYIETLSFKNPIETAKNLVPQLDKQADMVVALTHMGFYKDAAHGNNAPGDVTLARSMSMSEIDVIVGGHTHDKLSQPVIENGAIIVQAGDWGKYVGRLDLEVRNGIVTQKNYRLIPVNLKEKVKKDRVLIEEEIPESPLALAVLKPYNDKGKVELGKVIGSTDGILMGERKTVRSKETNLGNLIARAQRLKVGADLAVMGSGGIRTSIAKGDITYKDVLKVQPFSNTICVVTLSGMELKQYLEISANKTPGSGAFAQFENVNIVMSGKRLKSASVGGQMVRDDGKYKLAINSFMASGGDGYTKVSNHPTFVDTGYIDADILKEFIQKNSPLKIKDFSPTNDVIRE